MAVSPHAFPARKRRPSAGSFLSPHLSGLKLVQSLLLLSQEIGDLQPLRFLLRRNSSSLIRKSRLLAILFEDLLRNRISSFPASALLCFEETYILLQRIKTLIEDCSNGSRLWLLLMQRESVANSFHELDVDLSTLLDIFPVKAVDLNEDVEEIVILIRNQSRESRAFVDPNDEDLRREVLQLLREIEREIVPDHAQLAEIFERLGLCDSASCREEIERLEDEVQNQSDENWKKEAIALIGLARYAKCVLFGASTPRASAAPPLKKAAEVTIPVDFRCPITLDLMRDPVVVATGQTYDRTSIGSWIGSGHNTCPKTGQTLAHTDLISNHALKNLIAMWCREQKIPFDAGAVNDRPHGVTPNKAAFEATKMTASFLVGKLTPPPPPSSLSLDAVNRVVYELRVLAKTDSDSRACIAEAGAIPLLVRHLASNENANLQVNAVTAILNLSILEANKLRIMETEGALKGVIEVLRSGATWEAKGNAAATLFSLSAVHSYRKRLGRKTRVIKGLVDLANDGPTTSSKRDALMAIMNLAGDRDAVGRLIEEGVIEAVAQVMRALPEEAVAILELVVKRGGVLAVACVYRLRVIRKLAVVLREGPERARESAAATLVYICRKGGSETVAELSGVPGIERLIWELMGMGTVRAKRKSAALLRILRRWAAGLEADRMSEFSTTSTTTASTIVLPS